MSKNLTAEKALIFRITHVNNVEWVLDHGMYCSNASTQDPNFTSIGNASLIDRRSRRTIDVGPGGSLGDYVPFYFTPYSPMMLNITTGYGEVIQRNKEEIVIFVSSLHRFVEKDIDFVVSDRHAYLDTAFYSTNLDDLGIIDWDIIQAKDFKRDSDDPGKVERYQAEALAYEHVPIDALLGLICYTDGILNSLNEHVSKRDLGIELHVKPNWYFT